MANKIQNLGAFKARLATPLLLFLMLLEADKNAPNMHISVLEEDLKKLDIPAKELKEKNQQIVGLKLAVNRKGENGENYAFDDPQMREAVLRGLLKVSRQIVQNAKAQHKLVQLEKGAIWLEKSGYKAGKTNLEIANEKTAKRIEKKPVSAPTAPANEQEETAPSGDEESETGTNETAPKRGKKKDQ